MSRKLNKTKNKGRFAGIPIWVMESAIFVSLPILSKAFLLELAAQYNGRNNGYLSLTRQDLKRRGFPSPLSTQRAIESLVDTRLIVRTRVGRLSHGRACCSLYALGWRDLDEKIDKPLESTVNPSALQISFRGERVCIISR